MELGLGWLEKFILIKINFDLDIYTSAKEKNIIEIPKYISLA